MFFQNSGPAAQEESLDQRIWGEKKKEQIINKKKGQSHVARKKTERERNAEPPFILQPSFIRTRPTTNQTPPAEHPTQQSFGTCNLPAVSCLPCAAPLCFAYHAAVTSHHVLVQDSGNSIRANAGTLHRPPHARDLHTTALSSRHTRNSITRSRLPTTHSSQTAQTNAE